MIWGALALFLLSSVPAVIWWGNRGRAGEEVPAAVACIATFAMNAVAVVLLLVSCLVVVKSGHVGVKVLFGEVQPQPLNAGLHTVNPLCYVEIMSVQTDNYWMSHHHDEGDKKNGDDSVSVRSSNGLQMPVDVSVPYRLLPEAAPWVYSNLGKDYVSKILRPALSTATRRAASHYTAEDLYSKKRDEFSEKIRQLFDEELVKLLRDNYKDNNPPENVVMITQVLVGHVGIPETVKNAIESKLKADQEQQAMDFRIMREKKEAERKKVEAEGIQKFQDIVSKGINEQLLRWKAIEATLHLAESPNAKVVIIGAGNDGLPVLMGNHLLHDGAAKK